MVISALTYVSEILVLLYEDSVDGYEAMKRLSEVIKLCINFS